ncbi:MAG: hypothetical protein EOO03_08650 [Chitinophagaceae bacterium]|nr:MAG: hypothetical protein EOO03_08650 [Chitinophagaceae bacterium]
MTDTININTKSGMLGGLGLVLMIKTNWYDIFHSMILAAVGAGTSFFISLALGRFFKKRNR